RITLGALPPLQSLPTCDEERRKKEEDARGEREDEAREERSSDEGFMGMTPLLQAHHAMEKVEEFVHKVWEGRWRVIPHDVLPDWLKDNDFLLHGHRPPMPSFRACFRSIFRIHTETGNIWTHLLGCLFFLCLGLMYMFRPNMSFVAPVQEKVAIGMFFLGAILCLSFSWLFHTVYCHSEGVSRVFSKLDNSGIAFLSMGSFVPWLSCSFYCSPQPCFIYLLVVCVLGLSAITVSQCDFFATPQYRGVRAGVFVGLGLSGVVPTLHFVISEGLIRVTTIGQMGLSSGPASVVLTERRPTLTSWWGGGQLGFLEGNKSEGDVQPLLRASEWTSLNTNRRGVTGEKHQRYLSLSTVFPEWMQIQVLRGQEVLWHHLVDMSRKRQN
ncbi:adiponectin receptor protein 2-like, partial [Hippocampus comes]|uniref:adiponectin receptor protein 2-like n=1 Tax=Hippocampus comes TaxID=109280 RepID=UPI00094E1A8C